MSSLKTTTSAQRARAGARVLASLVAVAAGLTGGALALPSPQAEGGQARDLLLAGFEARSYRPGEVASLRVEPTPARRMVIQMFLAGGADAPGGATQGWDRITFGEPVTEPLLYERSEGGRAWTVHIRLDPSWASGTYLARIHWLRHTDYAPVVVRPVRLGSAPVLVVEPTNTWQAYNVTAGDSWYLSPAVRRIDLARPYANHDALGGRVPTGLPSQFLHYDLGFLRWYWHSGYEADFVSDDDLERMSAGGLRRYRLIVFAGHEEYVTAHTFDLITRYRDGGGNLAFLSANNFFYRVAVSGNTMTGRTPWRDLGRPEAALVGAEYAGWNEGHFPNRPYRITDRTAARWLFAGTNLGDGSTVGKYGIEVDEPDAASPPHTHVLAEIPNELGPGKPADMTIYRRGRSTVFDAGALNFGASAHWPALSRFFANLWTHLSA